MAQHGDGEDGLNRSARAPGDPASDSTPPVPILADPAEIDEPGADVLGVNAVLRLLRDEYAIDFSHYKASTVTRRIERRLALNRSLDIDTCSATRASTAPPADTFTSSFAANRVRR